MHLEKRWCILEPLAYYIFALVSTRTVISKSGSQYFSKELCTRNDTAACFVMQQG